MSYLTISLQHPPEVAWIGIGHHGGHVVERFLLPDLWCVHLFRDPMTLQVGDSVFEIKSGDATIIPPATPIAFHFRIPANHRHFYAHFRLGANTRINDQVEDQWVEIPCHQALGDRFEALCTELEAVLSAKHVPVPRAQAHLWSALWKLSRQNEREMAHPLVQRAQDLIEKRMAQPLRVSQLAHELGVSHNHLTRCFRAHTGQTVVTFIREARLARARHLLRHSTLPIKVIASQVGLGDFHTFGKAIRRASGHGPRAMREVDEGRLPNNTP